MRSDDFSHDHMALHDHITQISSTCRFLVYVHPLSDYHATNPFKIFPLYQKKTFDSNTNNLIPKYQKCNSSYMELLPNQQLRWDSRFTVGNNRRLFLYLRQSRRYQTQQRLFAHAILPFNKITRTLLDRF